MSTNPVLVDEPGKRVLLMGNEAIVRGALEAGVKVAAAYPGTPSSEIGDTLSRIAGIAGIYFEWSANEKVAFEVAYGASICNQRSLVAMKHVGLNVALDILNPVSLRGVKGGLVFISTDDPSQHSSRTEQDNRWLALQNCVPVLEPSSPQEVKDMMVYSYELSERVRLPVMIRTVTRLSHMRSDVKVGSISSEVKEPEFDWEGFSYRVAGFDKLFRRHQERHEKIDRVQELFEELKFNKLNLNKGELGIIGVGFAFNYVIDTLKELNLGDEVSYLKLASPYPLPERMVVKLLEKCETVLIVEEVDQFVELHVKALAQEKGLKVDIVGRKTGHLPREGELNPVLMDRVVADLLEKNVDHVDRSDLNDEVKDVLFERMLTLCAGCPHRSSIYALKKAVEKVKGSLKGIVINGDIGCYGLAHAPPMSFEDTYFCMGASIGVSQGMSKVGVDTIAWIGDGTFFHAGIPALFNAVVNNTSIKIVVADNGTTAMTGFQPNPQTGHTAMGTPSKKIMIEDVAKAMGVEHIEIVDPSDLEASEAAFTRMLEADRVSMVISRKLCATEELRQMRPKKPVPYMVQADSCIGCRICLTQFGCPALMWNDEKGVAEIDSTLCTGCGVCSQVCPQGAIYREAA